VLIVPQQVLLFTGYALGPFIEFKHYIASYSFVNSLTDGYTTLTIHNITCYTFV
jgi:hypothetical protein